MTKVIQTTIVIPCYNEINLINRCLDSIIDSNYDKNKLEVLIVDGGSNDGTRELINKYINLFDYFILLNNELRTQQHALNIGIKSAKGDYVIRFDTHAIMNSNYINECIYYLNNNSDVDAVGAVLDNLPTKNNYIGNAISILMSNNFGVGPSKFRVKSKNQSAIQTDTVPYGCYRKSVYNEIGFYNENLIASEDQDFHQRMKESNKKLVLLRNLSNTYISRSEINALVHHALRNGEWIVKPFLFVKKMNFKLKHFIPFFFTIFCLFLFTFSCLTNSNIFLYFLILYYSLSIIFNFLDERVRYKPIYLLILPFLNFLYHFFYGLGFFKGFYHILIKRN